MIGTKGRIENFGDGAGDEIYVWTTRTTSGFAEPDQKVLVRDGEGGHGGADPFPGLPDELAEYFNAGQPDRVREL